MMQGAQASFLPDGRRLHLHHGPIDLIVDASGPGRGDALAGATGRFRSILGELADELAVLRQPVGDAPPPQGRVARAMYEAVFPFAPAFVTPMAAVAGAVADEIIRVMTGGGGLTTAYVNNGGDVALYLARGHSLTAAIGDTASDRATIAAASPVRGVATSGWRGRSHSLGIADRLTVLARNAARADAAATLIANAVDLPGHPAIARRPAAELSPDSDLGTRGVTVDVGPMSADEVDMALQNGADFAGTCLKRGLIHGALLCLNARRRGVGAPDPIQETTELCHA